MAEKTVKFSDEKLEIHFEKDEAEDEGRLKTGKHSLDSDEEDDDGDKYDVLKEDDIEGQEDPTIDFDDDIQITPFNMKDEMEEGHFDSDGTFIFDKTKNIRDNWIDNIDWVRIKESERKKAQEAINAREEAQDEELPPVDKVALYKEMLDIMQPQETVAKALRRLGKSKGKPMTTAQRWKAKRQKSELQGGEGSEEREKAEQDKRIMLRLTEVADLLVQDGMMEIYEATREKISVLLKKAEEMAGKKFTIPDNVDDDDALDMFADNFDKQVTSRSEKAEATNGDDGDNVAERVPGVNTAVSEVSASADVEEGKDFEVRWEYKTENTDECEVLGPYTSSQMLTWQDEGKFKGGVFCRRVGTLGQFYSSARVDFDLYI